VILSGSKMTRADGTEGGRGVISFVFHLAVRT